MSKKVAVIATVATAAVTAIIVAAKFAIGKEVKEIAEQTDNRDFNAPCIVQLQASEFQITSSLTAWTLDGESGGEHTDVRIRAEKQALHIALPWEESSHEN